MSDSTAIDYSFVTGEAVQLKTGDKVCWWKTDGENYRNGSFTFCFTKLFDTTMECFSKNVYRKHKTITDTVSKYFTPALLAIAFIGFGYWLPINTYLLLMFYGGL
jgi:Cu+-exporting ATPase